VRNLVTEMPNLVQVLVDTASFSAQTGVLHLCLLDVSACARDTRAVRGLPKSRWAHASHARTCFDTPLCCIKPRRERVVLVQSLLSSELPYAPSSDSPSLRTGGGALALTANLGAALGLIPKVASLTGSRLVALPLLPAAASAATSSDVAPTPVSSTRGLCTPHPTRIARSVA
jgi:hypothetical protein